MGATWSHFSGIRSSSILSTPSQTPVWDGTMPRSSASQRNRVSRYMHSQTEFGNENTHLPPPLEGGGLRGRYQILLKTL